MRLIHKGHPGVTRLNFPKFGLFEFNPEGDVPDEFTEVIDFLKADGYEEITVPEEVVKKSGRPRRLDK